MKDKKGQHDRDARRAEIEGDAREYIEDLILRAAGAQRRFENESQERTDKAVKSIAKAVFDNAEMLARLATEETGMGNYDDKVSKNKNKARMVYAHLKGKKSRGIIERNEAVGITKLAKPVGIVGAVTPCTNPIVTPMSNAMFALKCGNAIIIAPHPKAKTCSAMAVKLMRGALKEEGFPENLIQIIEEPTIELTGALMSAVDVVIATGGMGMVKAVYSSGKPALGVGQGNVQVILDRGIDITEAVAKIVKGRAFDNGIICSGEQSVICPDEDFMEIMAEFEKQGAYIVKNATEKEKLRNALFSDEMMNRNAVGQNALKIAELADIQVPAGTKVIIAEADGCGSADSLAKEKMCPVIAAYRYDTLQSAVEIAKENLECEGKGHSVSIHSDNKNHIEYIASHLCASRFLVNQVCASSAGGSFQNGLAPTNTLGCGSWGNNSLSENLDYKHLMNVSRIAYFMEENPVPDDGELWK